MNEIENAFLADIMNEIIDNLIPTELDAEIVATVLDGVGLDEAIN